MTVKNLIKNNFVLVAGLALPALLMIGFMLAASLPAQCRVRPARI